jgi:uncharacterized cupredoxin-like copper-binding protein
MHNIKRNPRWAVSLCLAALFAAGMPALADSGGAHHQHDEAVLAQKPWGLPAGQAKATRTIDVVMTDDMRFTPNRIEVGQSEVIKFTVHNKGQLAHEFVIGSERELKEHAADMAKMPDMGHADANAVRVDPSATGELVWKFNRAGSFRFACLVPGHFEAGMAGDIVVAPARPAKGKS